MEGFRIKFDEDNPYGIQAINNIYVYVDNISDVEKTARTIDGVDYNTNYTFKAFDNFDASIKNTIMITLFTCGHDFMYHNNSYYLVIQLVSQSPTKGYGDF